MTRNYLYSSDEDPLISLASTILSSAADITPVGIQNETFAPDYINSFDSDLCFFEKSQHFAEGQ
jgi:hypothetical protein